MHCRDKKLGPDVDLNVVARGTPGFSGADLANLANEAAIVAVRDNREVLTAADFDAARDRILLGRREGSNVLLPEEKHAVAIHESGHALVAALSEHADPVAKVTILPAGQTLGVTEQLPLDERHLYGEDYLTDSLAVRLGGRAAELVEFGQGSTGAANDLASATDLATKMVREFGLSPALGPVGYPEGGSVFLGGGGPGLSSRPFAEATQATIDSEVSRLLREAEQTAVELIRSHRAELEQLVNLLLEHETVDGEEVYRIVGKPVPEHRPEEMAIAPHAPPPARPAPCARGAGAPAGSRHEPGSRATCEPRGRMKLLVLGAGDVRRCWPTTSAPTRCAARSPRSPAARCTSRCGRSSGRRGAAGMMALMPAYQAAPGRTRPPTASRRSASFPGNPAAGLDSHQGVVLLSSAATGEPLALLNASAVTEIRTAAVSAVATELLARRDATELAIIGTGVQARSHLLAIAALRPLTRIRVAGRDPAKARRFAAEHARAHRGRGDGLRLGRRRGGRGRDRGDRDQLGRAGAAPGLAGPRGAHQRGRGVRAAGPRARHRDHGRRRVVHRQPRVGHQRGRRLPDGAGRGRGRAGPHPGRDRRAADRRARRAGPTMTRSRCSSRSAWRSRTWPRPRWPTGGPPSSAPGHGWSSRSTAVPPPAPPRPHRPRFS